MGSRRNPASDGRDPAAWTLEEALAEEPPRPTLVWGDGVAGLASRLAERAPVRVAAATVEGLRGVRVPSELRMAPGADPIASTEAEEAPPTRFVVRLPRARDELAWRLHVAACRLPEGGEVWLAGHKREGIRAAERMLEQRVGSVAVARTKRHTRVLVARAGPDTPSGEPDPEPFLERFELPFQGETLPVVSYPGTFAHGRLDEGTRRLVEVVARAPRYRAALDLGCGSGALTLALARREPESRVAALDVAPAAVASTRHTLRLGGRSDLADEAVHLADADDAPDGPWELVVANPPFHRGRHEDRAQAGRFAEAAAPRIASGGQLLLVANRHLDYAADLRAAFRRVEVAAEDTRYRVYRCRRPR